MSKNIDDILKDIEIPEISQAEIHGEWVKVKARLPQVSGIQVMKVWLAAHKLFTVGALLTTVGFSVLAYNLYQPKSDSFTISVNKKVHADSKNSNTHSLETSVDKNPTVTSENILEPANYFGNIDGKSALPGLSDVNVLNYKNVKTENNIAVDPKSDMKVLKKEQTLSSIESVWKFTKSTLNAYESPLSFTRWTTLNSKASMLPKRSWEIAIGIKYIPSKIYSGMNFWNQLGAGIYVAKSIGNLKIITGFEYAEYNISPVNFIHYNFKTVPQNTGYLYYSDYTRLSRIGTIRLPVQARIFFNEKTQIRAGLFVDKTVFYYGNYAITTTDFQNLGAIINAPENVVKDLKQSLVTAGSAEPYSPYRNLAVNNTDLGLTTAVCITPDKASRWEFSVEGNFGFLDISKSAASNNSYQTKYFIGVDLRRYFRL